MDAKLKAKWVEALRSGEFEQTTGHLYRDSETFGFKKGYCCLGVACAVLMERDFSYGRLLSVGIDNAIQDDLMILNDTEQKSFSQIADYIEENL